MEQRRGRRVPSDNDQADGRDETEDERMDRNWIELLQELRVTQTGTQILTGFLLTIAFQPTFANLTGVQRTVYLILVSLAVITTALALAPVGMHRGLFRRHLKRLTVQTAHVIVALTLISVGLVLVGTVLLIFDVTVGLAPAVWAAATMLLILVALGLLPVILGRGRGRAAPSPRRAD